MEKHKVENYCIDCKTKIDKRSKRCHKCASKNIETRRNMSLAHIGKTHCGSFKKGHRVPKKWRKKISKVNKGKHFSPQTEFKKGCHINIREKNPNWNGGKTIASKGYILIRKSNHPYNIRGYVREHRLVMEKHLKRILEPMEVVHHINNIPSDNRIKNLILFPNGMNA